MGKPRRLSVSKVLSTGRSGVGMVRTTSWGSGEQDGEEKKCEGVKVVGGVVSGEIVFMGMVNPM